MSRNASPSTSSTKSAAWAPPEPERRPLTEPIEIPAAAAAVSGARAVDGREDAEEDGRYGGEVVPPHVLLAARRRAAFSMCSGQGRTLKGRDLRRVRDSVLRMTGFIES